MFDLTGRRCGADGGRLCQTRKTISDAARGRKTGRAALLLERLHMNESDLIGADLATRLISLPLAAMRAVAVVPHKPIEHMPACTVTAPAGRLLMAATPQPAPMFADTLEQVSRAHASDVLLIRGGRHPELIDAVTVDVALRYGNDALLLADMLFFRHIDKGLWLVPEKRGPFLELTRSGLRLEMLPPWFDTDERSAGLCRAAAEIARLTRRRSSIGH
ncbi:hypothetical protein FHS95_003781 [Sphingomonas naasensis]|uniref:Uncharacterized protein n=1 Tax=Sphingomonas naasensis TaxID=1344951 RepID=A0A4S1WMC0_9SPHN|nr:hypothetical protein [Sphingomonas naasensis]NIJ22070.1 hypothetical protein [Sphingomonas naasensis]TGX42256.1 hypothetical protein E5A74_10395 [Sphingomonas naasensis]